MITLDLILLPRLLEVEIMNLSQVTLSQKWFNTLN